MKLSNQSSFFDNNIKKVKFLGLNFVLGDERIITKKIIEQLKSRKEFNSADSSIKLSDKTTADLHGFKLRFVSEFDFLPFFFNQKYRRFLRKFDLLFPTTKFLQNRITSLNTNCKTKQNKIKRNLVSSSRLFINLLDYCFRKGHHICFIGTNREEENHLRRNFTFLFSKLSNLYFISNQQIKHQPRETLKFLNKSNYNLFLISPRVKNYKGLLIKKGPLVFSDREAITLYSQKKQNTLLGRRDTNKLFKFFKESKMIELLISLLVLPFKIFRWLLWVIPYRIGFFLSVFFSKIFNKY